VAKHRTRRAVRGSRKRVAAASKRGQEWAERQTPETAQGVAIDAWRHYRDVEGPLQSALLTLYVFVAVVPALIVLDELVAEKPGALATHIVRHYHFSATTATLVRSVLVHGRAHELQTAAIAIVGALAFGIGFGRVLQLVHLRAWGLALPSKGLKEVRHVIVLVAVYVLLLLLVVQLAELRAVAAPGWAGLALIPVWAAVLVGFFTWAPRYLTYGLISARDLLPSAVLTAVGLIVLMIASRYLMEWWVNWYAMDYGGFGVVMATFFWFGFSSAVIVWAASLAPSLATRRELLGRSESPAERRPAGDAA
jgi:membrane protein